MPGFKFDCGVTYIILLQSLIVTLLFQLLHVYLPQCLIENNRHIMRQTWKPEQIMLDFENSL